jgi:hypothetical protein
MARSFSLKTEIKLIMRHGLGAYLKEIFLDPYRPELHYMRGPGPKWHAKHGSLQQNDGRGSRLVVAPSDMTRASPDTLSASRR